MKKLITSIGACMLLASGFAAAKDMTFSGEIMDSPCAKGGGHESMFKKMGTNDPKACTEACIKMGGKYVLFNADKTFYQLDNQKKPAPFAGQKVEVTGTLNKATKTIHVTDIKASS
jgi:type 1 fimbria pilin